MTPTKRSRAELTGLTAIITAGLAIVAWVALPTEQGFVALAVIIVVGALAIWNRPPARDATGRRIRPTTVVNAILVLGMVAIPFGIAGVGLAGGRSAAPLILGIGFAVFALGAFPLYSFAWAVTKRPLLAATVALVVAGIAAASFSVPAFLDQLAGRNPF
jgi:hypothetical protein